MNMRSTVPVIILLNGPPACGKTELSRTINACEIDEQKMHTTYADRTLTSVINELLDTGVTVLTISLPGTLLSGIKEGTKNRVVRPIIMTAYVSTPEIDWVSNVLAVVGP